MMVLTLGTPPGQVYACEPGQVGLEVRHVKL